MCFVVIIIMNLHNKIWFANVLNVQLEYDLNQNEKEIGIYAAAIGCKINEMSDIIIRNDILGY